MHITADLSGDGEDYDVLYRGVAAAKAAIDGAFGPLVLEIGLRKGGSTSIIMDALIDTEQSRTIVSIDPYGNIAYDVAEDNLGQHRDYTNPMMQETLANLHLLAYQRGVHQLFFPLEDTEFMERFSDGVPIYMEFKQVVSEYAIVFFDGPHTADAVLKEMRFFSQRSVPGSVFIFDDVGWYEHGIVEKDLLDQGGWQILERSITKISYQKDYRS